MRSDKAARSWPGGRSREQLAQAEPAVTAEQTARNPRSDVVGPPIVAEVVLVDVPMKELQQNLMMDAEDRPLERSEISLGRVDMMTWTAPPRGRHRRDHSRLRRQSEGGDMSNPAVI